jgi:hypothetical protein
MVIEQGQSVLPEVVLASAAACCLASSLNCGDEDSNQNANNGNHYKDFDKRKGSSSCRHASHLSYNPNVINALPT